MKDDLGIALAIFAVILALGVIWWIWI